MNPNDYLLKFFAELESLKDGHGARHAVSTTRTAAALRKQCRFRPFLIPTGNGTGAYQTPYCNTKSLIPA